MAIGQIKNKISEGLKQIKADKASNLPYLLELLSVKESGMDKIDLSPEAKKDRVLETLKHIIMKAAKVRSLILAIEDLHWIDQSSAEFLEDLLEIIPDTRIFLIFTFRPDFLRLLSAKSHYHQVNLNRLSDRETLAMVTHLLDTADIDKDIQDLILKKVEGVPFFVEEFVKSYKDLKLLEIKNNNYQLAPGIQTMTIPSTIQDVIMARVDALTDEAKEVLQMGAVIERSFTYRLIKEVAVMPEPGLSVHITDLINSELLYERGTQYDRRLGI
jgi:predicted ATPase